MAWKRFTRLPVVSFGCRMRPFDRRPSRSATNATIWISSLVMPCCAVRADAPADAVNPAPTKPTTTSPTQARTSVRIMNPPCDASHPRGCTHHTLRPKTLGIDPRFSDDAVRKLSREGGTRLMPETSDAATLTAIVVAEEESRREAQAAAEAGELLPDDLLPGVGGTPMPLRDGLRIGGIAMIISLLLVNVIETFDQVALQVLAPDIQKSLDVSKTTLQGLTSLGGVVLVVATLPFAWLADRYVRTRILAAATTIWSVFMMLTGAVAAPWQMGFARAGAGFGASARIPISPSLIADKYPIGVRTRMFAFENLGRPLGLVLGPFIVGAVAAQSSGTDGWRWA